MANAKYADIKARIAVLEKLDEALDSILKEHFYSYECVNEEVTNEQATDWHGNLKWEDEACTIPKMRVERNYDYVKRPDEDLTDEDRAIEKAVESIRKALEKLI